MFMLAEVSSQAMLLNEQSKDRDNKLKTTLPQQPV